MHSRRILTTHTTTQWHTGVEHLLRDVKDATISTLSTDVSGKLQALEGLKNRLCEIQQYLEHVLSGKLPTNHDIMMYLQVRGFGKGVRAEPCSKSLRVINAWLEDDVLTPQRAGSGEEGGEGDDEGIGVQDWEASKQRGVFATRTPKNTRSEK